MAIGLFIVDAVATRALASEPLPGHEESDDGIFWITLLSFVLLTAIYRIVARQRFAQVRDHLLGGWPVPLVVLIATIVVYNVGESELGVQAMQVLWLVGSAMILGRTYGSVALRH